MSMIDANNFKVGGKISPHISESKKFYSDFSGVIGRIIL